VAIDPLSETDRRNIRGQKISIDTFPIVGEVRWIGSSSSA
jgi:uncharacterized protein with ACT and thioredoxin-like domain